MIILIEDKNGNDIGAIKVTENNIFGETEIEQTKGNVSIADIEFDSIFDTNDDLIRIQLTT